MAQLPTVKLQESRWYPTLKRNVSDKKRMNSLAPPKPRGFIRSSFQKVRKGDCNKILTGRLDGNEGFGEVNHSGLKSSVTRCY